LFPIDGEVETVQSAIDPLAPPEALRKQRRAYFEDARPVVFVVHPGEVVLCPRGWWHYAVALDHSVTVMRNFYNANTNVNALVGTIIAKARKTAVVCG
jgi:chloride channel 7